MRRNLHVTVASHRATPALDTHSRFGVVDVAGTGCLALHMIRVAYGAPMPHGGGALNYLIDLVEHHDRTTVEPVVFVDERLRNADSALERLARCGVVVHRGPMAAPLDQFLRTGWWEQVLRDAGPFDVANLHQHVPGVGRAFLDMS